MNLTLVFHLAMPGTKFYDDESRYRMRRKRPVNNAGNARAKRIKRKRRSLVRSRARKAGRA